MRLCVLNFLFPLWWFREYILSYYHHQIGSMNYHPLFRGRSWNNGMRSMSIYILTDAAINFLSKHFEHTDTNEYKSAVWDYQTLTSGHKRRHTMMTAMEIARKICFSHRFWREKWSCFSLQYAFCGGTRTLAKFLWEQVSIDVVLCNVFNIRFESLTLGTST